MLSNRRGPCERNKGMQSEDQGGGYTPTIGPQYAPGSKGSQS